MDTLHGCARIAVLVAALVAAPVMAKSQVSASDAAAWREDLRFLADELPRRHKNAFAAMTRMQWDSAARVLDERIPRLTRNEIVVELMRLVAMVRDGHTFIWPEFDAKVGFRRIPLALYDFADGLYVIGADSSHRALVGARVLRFGRTPAADALAAASALVAHESANWARLRAPSLLLMPQVLAGLGLSSDTAAVSLVVEENGRERAVVVPSTTTAERGATLASSPAWVRMRDPGAPEPVHSQRPADPFWFTILPDRTLYIVYRSVLFIHKGELNEAFFRRAFAAGDSARVERVVLDMRDNGGGNNFLNRFLVKEIVRRPALDQPDKFLVLIGRGVFSAAQNLVNELDYYTNATFVGEPTGNSPNQYGDPRPLALPRSQIRVLVSSAYWQGHSARDQRLWFTPHVFVEATSADYRAGRDPVFATAVRRATAPGLDRQLAPAAERGDTAAVRREIERYRTDRENKFRDIEADVNSAGYRLLRGGAPTSAAVAVFQVNAALFPESANVHDSLGEALERAGRRDEAVVSYRRAVALNPNQFSARDALARLSATPPP